MNLSDIFPRKLIEDKFDKDVLINIRTKRNLPEIAFLKPSCMAEIGGGAWDRYVQQNPNCDPQAIAPFFRENSPKIYLISDEPQPASICVRFAVASKLQPATDARG